jgi:hypothetical protein
MAGKRFERFREEVRGALDDASGVLDAASPHSDAWFELVERLQRSCWQLGSAAHCCTSGLSPTTSRRTRMTTPSRATRPSTTTSASTGATCAPAVVGRGDGQHRICTDRRRRSLALRLASSRERARGLRDR